MGWAAARRCEACGTSDAKYVGRLFHDFRRTAARNMRKSGVDEDTAMTIIGHKTPSMFRRYDIKDESDIREAQQKMMDYLKRKREQQKVTVISKTGRL